MRSFLLCWSLPALISSHGSLVDPPSRAVMWRQGYPDSPPDHEWMGSYCGGRFHQWSPGIDGRCGICGDPWDAELRQHEAPGGKFATGVIVREFQPGQVIPVTTEITANHVGFVEFRLCSNNNLTQDPTQDCFDRDEAVLTITEAGAGSFITETDQTKLWIEDVGPGLFSAAVRLPELECSQCILQWTYRNGRDWGTCNGACGPVETFRACADIAIRGSDHTTDSTEDTTVTETTAEHKEDTTRAGTTAGTTSGPTEGRCVATGAWAGQSEMSDWCEENCHHAQPFCPPEMCSCEPPQQRRRRCVGVGVWARSPAVTSWCEDSCSAAPQPFCPPTICDCS